MGEVNLHCSPRLECIIPKTPVKPHVPRFPLPHIYGRKYVVKKNVTRLERNFASCVVYELKKDFSMVFRQNVSDLVGPFYKNEILGVSE